MGLRYIKIVSLINISIFPGQGAPIILIYPEGPCNTYIQNRKKILSKVFFFNIQESKKLCSTNHETASLIVASPHLLCQLQ